jgi:hypothetical protein
VYYGGRQKLKNKGEVCDLIIFKDFALGGKSMSFVLVFWCLVLDLRLDFLVCYVYLGFLVYSRR